VGTTLATASAAADRLARAGLLDAVVSPVDRRRSELRVTAAGSGLLEGMRAQARQDLAASLAAMSPTEVAQARAGLAVLRMGFGTQQ
jgi:DNA-binding MarR family transcriptional regulator